MTIIQHGDPKKIQEIIDKRTLIFECSACGCRFSAEQDECESFTDETKSEIRNRGQVPWDMYDLIVRISPRWFSYLCPDCGTVVKVRKDKEVRI